MHELAVAESLVSKIEETAAGRRVVKVTLEVGALTCLSVEALSFSFDLMTEGTSAHGAELDVRRTPGDALNLKSLELEEMS
jgi:hydrogenase nickel incorporation protein HypA/HybF